MYFITTLERLPSDNVYDCGAMRCVGYYDTFEAAETTVVNNNCDICEYLYNYCVIEKIEQGLYRYALEGGRWFYKYNFEGTYDKIEEPEEFKHIAGFALG